MPQSTTFSPWQVIANSVCLLGESPFWHPQQQLLYWVDIAGRQLLRAAVDTGKVERWDLPGEPGCVAPASGGGFVLALRQGVFRAPGWQQSLRQIASLPYDPAVARANDGKCDAQGRFWIGTIDETRNRKDAALYCIDARSGDALVSEIIGPESMPVTTANGLAWSPDGSVLYWADTPRHTVWAWNFDRTGPTLSARRPFVEFNPKPAHWTAQNTPSTWRGQACIAQGYSGRPDGAAVDVDGNYWVAMYEGQQICQFSPGGDLLQSVPTPMRCPTMPCLGGEDLKTLFITSARHHRPENELLDHPLSGCVLCMRVETPGLPVQYFRD